MAIDDHFDNDDDPEAQVEVLRTCRKMGPLGCLHNCTRHTLKTPQRRERFQEIVRTYRLNGLTVKLLIGDDTCWIGGHDALDAVLLLREYIKD